MLGNPFTMRTRAEESASMGSRSDLLAERCLSGDGFRVSIRTGITDFAS
jgi:hypothetical protein